MRRRRSPTGDPSRLLGNCVWSGDRRAAVRSFRFFNKRGAASQRLALAVASAEPRRKERRGSPFLARPSAIVTASPLTGDIGSDAVGRKCFGRNLFVRACIELSHIKWLGWHRKGAIGSLRFESRICDHGDRRRSSSAEVQKAKAARGLNGLIRINVGGVRRR